MVCCSLDDGVGRPAGGYRVMIVSVVHTLSPYASPSLANQYSLEKGRARLVCLCSNKLARNSLLELLKPVQVSLPPPLVVVARLGFSEPSLRYLCCTTHSRYTITFFLPEPAAGHSPLCKKWLIKSGLAWNWGSQTCGTAPMNMILEHFSDTHIGRPHDTGIKTAQIH